MKIKPLTDHIIVKSNENKAGDLDISSFPTAVERGTVVSVGPDVTLPLKKGDVIHYKSWGVDIVSDDGENYLYISQSTNSIKGKIE